MDDLISREAAIELADWYQHEFSECDYAFGELSNELSKLPSAELQRWIPVSERLPEPNSAYEAEPVYYLVQNEYDDAMVATFVKFPGGARIWQQMYQDGAIMDDIVAWMPLPEPWKGEER